MYKGLWRGTEVAIKTMMLAANLSGEEGSMKKGWTCIDWKDGSLSCLCLI